MSVGAALLAAVVAQRDDDFPRLAYADWLEEHGDPRGEFIRIQCRLARPGTSDMGTGWGGPARHHGERRPGFTRVHAADPDPAYDRLERREWDLLATHGSRWREELPRLPGITWGEFHRGFVDSVSAASPAGFRAHAAALWAAAPVRRLRLTGELTEADVRGLVGIPEFGRLTELAVGSSTPPADAVRALADSPQVSGLTALGLDHCRLDDAGARALALSPHLVGLRGLRFFGCDLQDSGARALVEGLAERGAGGGGQTPGRGVTHLDLSYNGLSRAGAEALAAAPPLARLEVLNLLGNGLGAGGARALVSSPHLTRLRGLNLTETGAGAAGARALADAPNLRGLRWLGLYCNDLGDEGVASLAGSPYLGDLRVLCLGNNGCGDGGARALAASGFRGLRHLIFQDHRVSADSAAALRERFGEVVKVDEGLGDGSGFAEA